MAILQGLVVIGILHLVAVPTLTTPLLQDKDEFVDQLKAMEDPFGRVQIDSENDVDDLIEDLMDLGGDIQTNKAVSFDGVDKDVVDAINQFKDVDDLGDELLDEVNLGDQLIDEVNLEDELKNLSGTNDGSTTDVANDSDEPVNDLIDTNLGDSNKTVTPSMAITTGSTDDITINEGSTSKTADDDLVNDLMDLKIVEEVVSEVVTELVLETEPVAEGTVAQGYDDYETITDLVTEVVYDVIPNEAIVDNVEPSLASSFVTSNDDMQPTSTSANQEILSEDQTAILNIQEPESTTIVTEIITDIQTATEFIDDVADEVDVETEMTRTVFPDDEELEEELWDLEAATDETADDDAPTFVFSSPYPTILSSDEAIDFGPDLEITTTQPGLDCGEGRFACADGRQCVLQDTVCDLMLDCADGSDENSGICQLDRECPPGFTKCNKSPQCIEDKDWCDGVFHCYNGADEKNCMSCIGLDGGEKRLLIEDFCDGVQDCDDNYDETSERCNHPCPLGSSKCADGLQCITDDLFCNGYKNCKDGSDEYKTCDRTIQECERFGMFSCDGVCIIKSALCDGMTDCKDGVDEKGCSDDIFSCPDGFSRRKKDHSCVHQSILTRDP
nr:uncharacterized protein LOC129257436 [Lytechinus pictus]